METSVAGIGHVGISVTDLGRSVRFYLEVVGLELIRRSDDDERPFAFLGLEGAPLVTLWQQAAGSADHRGAGLHHLAFTARRAEDLETFEQRLTAAGAVIHHGGVVAHAEGRDSGGLFFEDPDGNRLEISVSSGLTGAPAPSGSAPTCGFF